jgi:hypothetical protein
MKATLCAFLLLCGAVMQAQPGPPPNPCCWPPPPSGLVDCWTFDEPAGPPSSDFGGAVNNVGTDHGVIPRVPGEVGRAVSFNGTTWIEVANQNEINFLGDCVLDTAEPLAIDFWIRTTQANGTVAVLDKRDRNGSTFLRGYEVYISNGKIGFQMALGSGNQICNSSGSACSNFTATSLPSVATGQWTFVGITLSRCRGAQGLIYVAPVNGVPATQPFTPRVGSIVSVVPLTIGRQSPTTPGNSMYRGELDELEFFKAFLTKTDFDNIFNKKCAGKCRMY